MNQQSINNPQFISRTPSAKSHLTRTPLQSKINTNLIPEHPKSKHLEKTPELFKQKSFQPLSQLKNPSIEHKTQNITEEEEDNDNDTINYNKTKDCNSFNCIHMHSPVRELKLDLSTPPHSSSPIAIHNEYHLAFSPLKINQLNYVTSGDIELIRKFDNYINEPIDYQF